MGGKNVDNFNIYKDIADRTQGDIYVGVVDQLGQGNLHLLKSSWILW